MSFPSPCHREGVARGDPLGSSKRRVQTRSRSSRHDGLPHRSLAFSPGNVKGRLALLDQEIKELGFWD